MTLKTHCGSVEKMFTGIHVLWLGKKWWDG